MPADRFPYEVPARSTALAPRPSRSLPAPQARRAVRALARTAVLPTVVALLASGCWSQYRGDLAHSGNQAFEFGINAANVSTLAEGWLDATGGAVTTAPTIADGVAYVGAGDGKVYAFDAAGKSGCGVGAPVTCAPLWTATVASNVGIRTSPVVAGGVVYVQGRDALMAFDAAGVAGCGTGPAKT